MITRLYYYFSPQTVPYRNLAVEAYLLETVPEGAATLYLWQNRRTVVVGRHQNAWAECQVSHLEEDGGYLVRRLSGGGAVYHDEQNLNFTFLVNRQDYDVSRQLEVIIQAVRGLGLDAQKSGRNDITIDGRKFSGNAFYLTRDRAYHHGTILVDVDTQAMGRYLTVSPQKLQSKGVASVRSRVVNLKELRPDLTIPALREALITAFGQVYGATPEPIPEGSMDEARLEELEAQFSSWDWKFGRNVPFSWEAERRFPWGGVQIRLSTEKGRVTDSVVYSDAMDAELIASLPGLFTGRRFDAPSLVQALPPGATPEQESILADLRRMLAEELA